MKATDPDVVIYTKPTCPWCMAALRLLRAKGLRFREIDLFEEPERREEMIRRSGRTTVPQVFIRGRAVGGYDDLAALEERGELDRMLAGGGSGESAGGD